LLAFPTVNRAGKGDRLVPRRAPQPAVRARAADASSADEAPRDLQQDILDAIARDRAPKPAVPAIDEIEAAIRFVPFPESAWSPSLDRNPQTPRGEARGEAAADQPALSILDEAADPDPTERTARLFFGRTPIGALPPVLERWSQGEEPVLIVPQ